MVRTYSSKPAIGGHLDSCRTEDTITDYDRGEILCSGCGLVLVQGVTDTSSEGRAYNQSEYMTQTRMGPGNSLTINDKGLSTVMGRDIDATGNTISSATKKTFDRLRLWDQRSRPRSTASLSKALVALNAIKSKLAIPDSTVEDAAYTYRKIVSAKITRGRTIASLIAVSAYISCRQSNIPRSLDEVARAANISKKLLARDLRIVIKKLDLRLGQYDMSSFITKIANNLKLKEKTKRDALSILERSVKRGITTGKHPVAQAAASLYIACITNDEPINQRMFSRAIGVSEVTIRNRSAQIRETLGLDDE